MKLIYSTGSSDDSAATTITQSSSSSSEDFGVSTLNRPKRRQRRNRCARSSRSTGRATSTKAHDAPMQKKDMYFALDCEMVGVGPEGLDSALARVSIINWNNEIVLDTYVKVEEEVTDYRTFVSGIRPEHIQSESAIGLNQARAFVSNILKGKILIGHALENDLKALDIQHPECDTRDTATYAPYMRTISKENDEKVLVPKKLKDLVWDHFQREIQVIGKSHSPVEDAIAAMDLYKACRNVWEMQKSKEISRAQQSRSPLQDNKRDSPAVLGQRTGADHGSQLLFAQAPQQVAQFVMPMAPMKLPMSAPPMPHQHQHQHPRQHFNYPYVPSPYEYPHQHQHQHQQHQQMIINSNPNMNKPKPIGRAKLATARRSQELARAKVVAALHQQRLRWQEKQQQQRQQRTVASN